MSMKRLIAAGIAAALTSLIALSPAALAEVTLQLGHPTATTSHYGVAAAAFVEEVAKRTNGKFKIVSTPNGAEREMIESVQIGTLDFVITSTGPLGNFVPEVAVVDIPFLFRDYAHAHAVLDGPIGQDMLDLFPAKGLVALAWGENGFRHLTNRVRSVKAPEDAKGLKVRTMENQVHMTAFRTLGVLPTPMAFTELFTALQQGTVDGQENPIPVITAAKLFQVQKYLSLTGHVYSPALFLMSKSTFDGLKPEERQMFVEAAKTAAKAMRDKVATVEKTGVEELRAAGMEVTVDIDRQKFLDALTPAYTEYAKRFGTDTIERIRNFK